MKSRPSQHKGYGGPNNRDPLLDTGVPGVIVSRAIKKDQKRVVVSAAFQMGQPGGKPKPVMRYVGSLFEGALADDPLDACRRFSGFLRKAMAIRRYAESFYERGEYPASRLHYDDVPGSIVEMVPEPPVMDLRAIMDSFEPGHASGESEADLDGLALTLQGYTLERRRPPIVFNGHRLTFHSLMAEGVRVFVPEQMGRGRDHWWLTVDTEDGQILDEIYDGDHGGGSQTSLREAWLYLVSLLRAHPAR
ncbi:hypothetical protein Maqu_4231 (plasmid) [Marinobacter nauticus VT8]|uniref:Uncharacterized protein n=1 Tax=Marinobacter nauticus (strain ATCC 700491 / DSM 11845 / VT8) TaxID=351348 RepID=A1U7W3_MARN8|nr:hypothetical protein Maqu_4231 [Marinobacter nauticus VT8]